MTEHLDTSETDAAIEHQRRVRLRLDAGQRALMQALFQDDEGTPLCLEDEMSAPEEPDSEEPEAPRSSPLVARAERLRLQFIKGWPGKS